MGWILCCAFELSQLDVGLSGNYLLRDYNVYSKLATHSWFKLLWEYAKYYRVKIELDGIDIAPVRERDHVLMNAVTQILPSHQWESFNRARKFFTVYLMLQIILSDGMTVDPEKVQARDHQQSESIMVFPTSDCGKRLFASSLLPHYVYRLG